jgi:hypothetical protein
MSCYSRPAGSPLAGLLFLCFLILTPLASCCQHPVAISPTVDIRNSAERAESKSVAIMQDKTDHAQCGGVWVSSDTILSAFHCMDDAGKPEDAENALQELLKSMGMDIGPVWDPIGQTVWFKVKGSNDKWPAVVTRFDRDTDLGLIRVKDGMAPPEHDIAKLAVGVIRDGTPLDVVGSYAGHEFTYSRCFVAKTQDPDMGDDDKNLLTLEVTGPMYPGDSGGGAYDPDGNLVGIADFMQTRAGEIVPDISWFTHRDVIKAFLANN